MSTPDLSLLPLKPGDQLWRRLSDGTCWHALYVGQFLLVFAEDGVTLTLQPAQGEILPPCVVAVQASEAGGAVTRIPLTEFVDPSCGPGDAKETEECTSPTRVSAADISVRLYARRPRGRRAAVARALTAIGTQVDRGALLGLPELLPWWAIFDESNDFQPGLCASRSRAVRYRLSPKDTDYGTTDRKLHSFGEFHVGSRGSSYLPGKLLQQRLPRTFNESMENIAQERREEYGMPRGVTGLGRGFRDRWTRAERVNADWLLSHRARTFNGSLQGDRCGSSPIQTPAGTFIATPTWSESGDVFVPRRDDPCSPLYVQATPQRWASEHCQEMSQPSAPLQSAHMYHPGFGLLGPDQAAFLGTFGGNKFEIHKTA